MEIKKDLYANILRISKEIELLIQFSKFDKIETLLTQREEFLALISKNDGEIEELQEIREEIKALDKKNYAKMDEFKQGLSEQMLKVSKKIKVIGAYKQEEIYKSRLVDERNS